MGLLKTMFGPSRDQIWQQFSLETGASYVKGGFWKGTSKVQATHGEWTITLDTVTQTRHDGATTHYDTFTRIRAPFVNRDGFRFTIYRKSFFSPLGKWLGMQDVEIGDPGRLTPSSSSRGTTKNDCGNCSAARESGT